MTQNKLVFYLIGMVISEVQSTVSSAKILHFEFSLESWNDTVIGFKG